MADMEQVLSDQAAMITSLQAQVQALHQRLGPEDTGPVAPGGRFPMAIYKLDLKKSGVDHPGFVSKVVGDQNELDAHVKAGWLAEPPDAFVYPDDEPELVAAGPAKKKTSK